MPKKKRKLILTPSTVKQRPVLEAILADTTCGYSLQFQNLSPDCYISIKHVFNGSAFNWGVITPMSQEDYFRGKFNRARDDYVPFCLWSWFDLYCSSTRDLNAKPYEYTYNMGEMVAIVRNMYQDVVRTVENAVTQWSPDIVSSIIDCLLIIEY